MGGGQDFTSTFVASAILLILHRCKARFLCAEIKWGSTCTVWFNSGMMSDLLPDNMKSSAGLPYLPIVRMNHNGCSDQSCIGQPGIVAGESLKRMHH